MKWTYRPALDGVRTLAVYLVLLYHAGMPSVAGGFIGVDLFFVLSGFLVSNVILCEIDEHGSLRLGRFYARRIRRLLPAAVLVVVATGAVFVLVTSIVHRLAYVDDARSALLYFANWRFLEASNDYFATGVDRSPYLHFWSLAIEEQFYVFFPMVLIALVALNKRWRRALPAGLAVLMIASIGSQLYWLSADPVHAYYGTDARLYQLLAGALLAVLMRQLGSSRYPALLSGIGLVLMLLGGSGVLEIAPTWRGLLATAAAVVLLLGIASSSTSTFSRLLGLPIPAYLGKISYGTYLWHWPVLLVVSQVIAVRPAVLAVIGAAVSTGLAALSYQIYEMPIRKREWSLRVQWPVVLTGLTASALVAFAVMPPMLQSERRPALVDAGAAFGSSSGSNARVPTNIDFAAAADDIGAQHSCSTPADCFIVKGDGPTVVLIGDSHARMLTPLFRRLAVEHGFNFAANVQTGCPWQKGIVNERRPPAQRRECILNRGAWYRDVLPDLHPDLVVVVSQSYDESPKYNEAIIKRIGGSDESLEELLLHTTEETLDQFSTIGTRTLVVQSIIQAPADPLDCLASATYIAQCTIAVPIGQNPSDSFYVAEDVRRDDMFTVDINPVVCPDAPLCRPILDGRVVWRDYNHLTVKITLHLRGKFWARIGETGALAGLDFGN